MTCNSTPCKPHTQDEAIRELIAAALKLCSNKNRTQIAKQMSERLGQRITIHMLNSYTSSSKTLNEYGTLKTRMRFPAAWVLVFCDVVNDDRLARLLLPHHLQRLLEIGELVAEGDKVWSQIDVLRKKLRRRFDLPPQSQAI